MSEEWRHLKVGDRIRITHIPEEFLQPGYCFPSDIRRLYEDLIAQATILVIVRVDEWQIPWIDYEWVHTDGVIEYHTRAVNDSSWELV